MRHDTRNRYRPADSAAEDFDSFFHTGWPEEDADESAFPEWMASDPDWAEISAAGYSHIDVARAAFPEIAEADDLDVEDFLWDMTEGMTEAELESFWGGLANFGRKALKVAAPVVQKAAPIVGTAVGAAFGGVGAPIGGAIGNLVGQGAGALNAHVNRPRPRRRTRSAPAPRRPSGTRTRSRSATQARRDRRRRQVRRVVRTGAHAVGVQMQQLLQDPQIQQALLGLAQRGVGAVTGARGETMTESAAIAGLIGGLRLALSEAQEQGVDLDAFDGDYAPEDFGSDEEAFHTLVALIGSRP